MLTTFFIAFSTLFAIVDPIACIGPFLAVTDGSQKHRRVIARKATIIATIVLLICGLGGTWIFRFFGITLPALKLAGGLLLFVVSFEMLHAQQSRVRQTREEQEEGAAREDVAVFPLAMPLLAGPGAIASVFILMERASSWIEVAMVYISIVVTMAASYIVLYSAQRLANVLGSIGINVFTRVMGLMLAAISMQFVIDAIHSAFP